MTTGAGRHRRLRRHRLGAGQGGAATRVDTRAGRGGFNSELLEERDISVILHGGTFVADDFAFETEPMQSAALGVERLVAIAERRGVLDPEAGARA